MRASSAAWLIVLVLAGYSLALRDSHGAEITGLKLRLTANKAVYAPREPITLTLRVVNETSSPVRLSFPTSQRFDLVMQDGNAREVWRWSAGWVFAQMLGEETLNPSGAELRFEATARGNFPPGFYTVTGLSPALEGNLSARTTITVR